MDHRTLGFIALALSMIYGVGFAAFGGDAPTGYAAIGAVIVTLAWIAVGVFGRGESRSA